MIQFEKPINGVNIFKGLESPLVIGDIPPVDDSFGLEKHIEQDSIMIFREKDEPYDIYFFNQSTATWFLYATISDKQIPIVWPENITRIFFVVPDIECTFRIIGQQGPIIADIDPSDGITNLAADKSLVMGQGMPTYGFSGFGGSGAQGHQGHQGHQGNDGDVGDVGAQGNQGHQGHQGNDGADGNNAYTDNDVSSWLNGNYDHHIIPSANAQYDLGNAEYKIRHLFLSDNSVYMGDKKLGIDSTNGLELKDAADNSLWSHQQTIDAVKANAQNSDKLPLFGDMVNDKQLVDPHFGGDLVELDAEHRLFLDPTENALKIFIGGVLYKIELQQV